MTASEQPAAPAGSGMAAPAGSGMAPPAGSGVPPAVSVRGLTKRFGQVTAVDDVSFDVPPGRVVGFLGPNGAGKSTTLRTIVGLTTPSSGSATILGSPFHELRDPIRTVGSIVDGVGFHPGRRAIEELRVTAAAGGIPARRCDEVLELVGLAAVGRKRVGAFSLGMKQRLGLAAALLGDPQVLLLDEPANGLDPEGIQWVRRFLRDLADDGRAILVSSHLLGEVSRLVDEVIVIRRGRLVGHGTIDELTAAAGGGAVVVASLDNERLAAALTDHGAQVSVVDGVLNVVGPAAAEVGGIALRQGIALTELRPVAPELEDVFLELTAGGGIA